MSGVVFFSSPLRPINQFNSTPNPFHTPQTKSWTSHVQLSPLQTSRNANVMSQKPSSNDGQENTIPEFNQTPKFESNTFFLNPTPPTSTTTSSRASQFQARARSNSPSVQLQSITASKRDSRKRLFLDRLRNKRDDERFERGGDQLLRLDYIKERKQWEAEMQKKQLDETDEMEEDSEMYEEQEEPSPTEDKEIEELVSYLTEEQNEDEFSDEDYDALFMEVMNQESDQKYTVKPPDIDMDMS